PLERRPGTSGPSHFARTTIARRRGRRSVVTASHRGPGRGLVGTPGDGADAQNAQAVRAAGEDAAGARVDPDQVVGVERQSLVADQDRAGAGERDVELLLAGVGLVVGLGGV